MTKNDRLDLRLSAQQKSDIARAAAIAGRSVTDFSVSVLAREAEEIIRSERDVVISRESWAAFTEVIERPARPVDGLADLLQRPSVFAD